MRTLRAAFAGLAGLALAGSVITASPAGAAVNNGGGPLPARLVPINLLSINDFHGRITNTDLAGNTVGTLGKNFACTYLTQRTALGGNTLQPAGSSRPYLALGLSDNVTYTYDPSRSRGSRILSVFVNGAPLDPAKIYSIASNSYLIASNGTVPDGFATLLHGTNYRDTGLVDQNAFMDWIKAHSPISPSPVQHGVGVIVNGSPLQFGKTSGTFRLEGFDLASKGAVANTSVSIGFDGRPDFMSAPITTQYLDTPLPTRDGVTTFSFKLSNQLPGTTKGQTVYLRVTAHPSGTVAMVPVTVAK